MSNTKPATTITRGIALIGLVSILALLAGCGASGGRVTAPSNPPGASSPPSPAPSFVLELNTTTASQTVGQAGAYTLTIVPSGGFSGRVSLSYAGSPATGLTIGLPRATLSAGKSETVSVTAQASGIYTLSFYGSSGSLRSTATITLTVAASQGIAGVISDGLMGAGLGGAQINVLQNGNLVTTTTTNSQGFYQVGLTPGSYTVESPGQTLNATLYQGGRGSVSFAATEVVGVPVSSGQVTPENLPQYRAASANLPSLPPTLSLPGLSAGQSVPATGPLLVDLTVNTETNPIFWTGAAVDQSPLLSSSLLWGGLGLGSHATQLLLRQSGTLSTFYSRSVDLNLPRIAGGLSGPVTIEIAVMDTNYNRAVYLFPVNLTGLQPGSGLSNPVSGVKTVALTESNLRARILGVTAPQAAPQGANLIIGVSWSPYTFPVTPTANNPYPNEGYYIYRRLGGGSFTLAGVAPVYYSPSARAMINPSAWLDTGPLLAAGQTTGYYVQAFDRESVSPASGTVTTTPLPALTAVLQVPAEGAGGVNTAPAFSWTTNGVGVAEYFVPILLSSSGYDSCGLGPASGATGLTAILQDSTELAGPHWMPYVGTVCGVTGGSTPADGVFAFTYVPNNASESGSCGPGTSTACTPNTPLLQPYAHYQWELFEAVAVNNPASPTAFSVWQDQAGIFFPDSIFDFGIAYGAGMQTYQGDQVYSFTTGGN